MFEWLEKRAIKVEYAFSEIPKLKWLFLFYMFMVFLAIKVYQPLIVALYKFNIMGVQEIIQQNVNWVMWGQAIFPMMVAIWGYVDMVSFYEEKHIKKHGQLPHWVN